MLGLIKTQFCLTTTKLCVNNRPIQSYFFLKSEEYELSTILYERINFKLFQVSRCSFPKIYEQLGRKFY